MPDTDKKIRIYETEFSVPQPYAEGQSLSAIEAKVLNQCFAENIANNQRKFVKAAMDGGDDAPTMDEVVAGFAEYAAAYEFSEAAAGGSRSTKTPLEREAEKIAKQLVNKKLRDSKRTKKDVSDDDYAAAVAKLAEDDKVLKIAKRRVKENEELAALNGAGEAEAEAEAA